MKRFFQKLFPQVSRRASASAATSILLLGSLVGITACTAPKYKMAPKATPPPVMLNLPSTEPPIEALLHTVIVYRGPGSWKRDAYWDEYVMTVANRGNTLIFVDSAELIGLEKKAVTMGVDPWDLEKSSRTLIEQGFGFAQGTAIQVGGGVSFIVVGGGVGAMVFSGGYVTAAGGAALGGVLLLPAFIGGTIYSNISNRHAVEREFERRRLVLPMTLVPGQFVQGSLFFRVTPGPQQLKLGCIINGGPRDVVIDLTSITGLHLKSTVTKAKQSEADVGRANTTKE